MSQPYSLLAIKEQSLDLAFFLPRPPHRALPVATAPKVKSSLFVLKLATTRTASPNDASGDVLAGPNVSMDEVLAGF